MTSAGTAGQRTRPAAGREPGHEPATEHELAAAVVDTLLREDYGGLTRLVRTGPAGPVLDLPRGPGKGGSAVPLEPDGFLTDLRIRRPGPPLTLDDVAAMLAAVADPADHEGVAAFTAECRQALAALRLRRRELPAVPPAPGPGPAPGPAPGPGPAGQLGYDALAAAMPHPAYPTSPCRLGFTDADSLRYAPEYRPEFELNWVAVPRDALVRAGRGDPPWWPQPADLGLPASLAETHDLLPVHPLTARRELIRALTERGLIRPAAAGRDLAGPARAVVAPGTCLRVTPTLSTRTVAVTGQPGRHLKLPLPTSTLGLRNQRSIVPGTLADGALVRSLVAAAVVSDSRLDALLLADEGSYTHAGHPYLAYLLRRLPGGLDQCRIVPVAALLAPDMRPDRGGRPLVIEELARWSQAGDLMDLFRRYLRLLFGLHVQLFVRYGIALEAHQQNAALVVGPTPAGCPGPPSAGCPDHLAARPDPAPGRWLRLLVKDFDGALINGARLGAALRPVLGTATPSPSAFADGRLLTDSDDALADVFITIVVHLCAGALAFGLAERRAAPLPALVALIREELTDALDQHGGEPAATLLRARVLDADRLPGKSMVTAGTLVAKARTGAHDINKFYGTSGPNYLKYPNARGAR